MTATPPPPPPYRPNLVQEKAPVVAWLVPLAGALAAVGAFTPWFKPEATISGGGRTQTGAVVEDALYSWKEGKLGLIAPIVLVLLSFAVVGLLTGRSVSRFERGSSGPVVNAARGALIAGVVAVASVAISYFLLPSQYKFTDGAREYSWDELITRIESQPGIDSVELSQGPQLGLWLTLAAAVVAIVGGVLMLIMRTKVEPANPVGAPGYGAPQSTPVPPPPGYQPQGFPPAHQQPGQQPPPPGYQSPGYQPQGFQPGYQQPGYQAPPQGYQPPRG